MRQKGKITSWNDPKGFGFIAPSEGGKDVFLHISAFSNSNRRPEAGQFVSYTLSTDARGRPRASRATLPGERLSQPGKNDSKVLAFIVVAIFLGLLVFSVLAGEIPALILWVYLAVSLTTYFVYAFDKTAAKDGAWRTKEGTLHWLSLLGGWPGALLAQQTLRHKSKKRSFQMMFWISVFLNVGALAWVYTPAGTGALQSWTGVDLQANDVGRRATIEWVNPGEQ